MALPKWERLVITLRYFEELPDLEIAKVLELPLESVQTFRERGLAKIRSAMR